MARHVPTILIMQSINPMVPINSYRFQITDSRILQLNSRIWQFNSRILQLNSRILQLNSRIWQLNSCILQLKIVEDMAIKKESESNLLSDSKVSKMRLELTQPTGHYPLKVARLPIPPPGHFYKYNLHFYE